MSASTRFILSLSGISLGKRNLAEKMKASRGVAVAKQTSS